MSRVPLLSLLLMTSCFATRVQYGADTVSSGRTYTAVTSSFLFGMISIGRVNAASYCGQRGIQSVRTAASPLGLLTAGLWTPMITRIRCAE